MLIWLAHELCMLPRSSAEMMLMMPDKLPKKRSMSSCIDIDLVNWTFTVLTRLSTSVILYTSPLFKDATLN